MSKKKDTAEVANKVRADLVKEKILKEESLPKAFEWDHPSRFKYYIPKGQWTPKLKGSFTAEHFKDDDPKDIKRRLVDPVIKRNTTYNYVVSAMSDQEVRDEMARRLNDGSLTCSTYTMHHLNKRKEQL